MSERRFELPYGTRRIPFTERDAALWPGGARLAVGIYIAVEEWLWDESEPHSARLTRPVAGESIPSLSTRTAIRYGFEVGLHRMREALNERGIPATFWVSGTAAEQHSEIIRQLDQDGHEIAAHSYTQGRHMNMLSRDEQRDAIRLSVEHLGAVTGKRPAGWISPSAVCDLATVELLIEEGFTYHADLQDDELPYFIDIAGGTILEIPYRMAGNINDFLVVAGRSNDEAFAFLKQAFDAYYEESKKRSLQFVFGTHPFVSGRPDTASTFARFLDYVTERDDVWVAQYRMIAEHWIERFGEIGASGRDAA